MNQYKTETTLNELIIQRQVLRNKVRRCSDKQQLNNYKNEIYYIKIQIKSFTKDIGVCEKIKKRINKIVQFEKEREVEQCKVKKFLSKAEFKKKYDKCALWLSACKE